MAGIHITDIEAAINYWRQKNPSPDGVALPRELRALAEVYDLMVYYNEVEADEYTLPLAASKVDTQPEGSCAEDTSLAAAGAASARLGVGGAVGGKGGQGGGRG